MIYMTYAQGYTLTDGHKCGPVWVPHAPPQHMYTQDATVDNNSVVCSGSSTPAQYIPVVNRVHSTMRTHASSTHDPLKYSNLFVYIHTLSPCVHLTSQYNDPNSNTTATTQGSTL